MLRQAENKVNIEGIVSEMDVRHGEAKSTGKPYIMADLKVRLNQDINGETRDIELPVKFFAMKDTKTGGVNPSYTSIKKMEDTFVSIAACGDVDKATRVRIDRATIRENAFYGQGDTLVTYPQISASFVNSIDKAQCSDKADFVAVIVIGGIREEVRNDEPTGRIIIRGIIPQYGEQVDVVDFIVASNEAINHIQTYWNEGDTVRVAGKVNFSSRVIHEEKSVGFGEPIIEDKTITVRELIVTSGSQSAFDGDMAYAADEIKAALADRQKRLEEMKNKNKTTAAPAEKKSSVGFDF